LEVHLYIIPNYYFKDPAVSEHKQDSKRVCKLDLKYF
jgi:hypothetical protein